MATLQLASLFCCLQRSLQLAYGQRPLESRYQRKIDILLGMVKSNERQQFCRIVRLPIKELFP